MTRRRLEIWNAYHSAFEDLESRKLLQRPIIARGCAHNAHMYYLLLPDFEKRTMLIDSLRKNGVQAVFHYIPLHDSPAGKRYGRSVGDLAETSDLSDRLVRLPFWLGLEPHIERVIELVAKAVT